MTKDVPAETTEVRVFSIPNALVLADLFHHSIPFSRISQHSRHRFNLSLKQLKPVNSRQLVGHLGHLTPEQEGTLKKFKERLEKEGYFTPAAGNKAASHDDVTLV